MPADRKIFAFPRKSKTFSEMNVKRIHFKNALDYILTSATVPDDTKLSIENLIKWSMTSDS